MEMKICRTCGELKPLDDFYRHYHTLDGHKSTCKACECAAQNARRAAKKEGVKLPPIEKLDTRKNLAERRGRKRPTADRPVWYYKGSMADNIRALEADRQPWLIAKYRTAARFVAVDSAVVYELIIFQTYEADECYDTLTMTRDEFHDLMAALGLPLKPRYESPFGRIFGRDDRLRDIVRKWQALDEGQAEAERRLFARYTRAGMMCSSHPEDEALAAERKAARIAYKTAVAERASAKAAFLKENRITLYNF